MTPPPEFGERFDVVRTLGAGGMGVVYEVFDKVRGTAVALKTLRREDDGARGRFRSEFRALAAVEHPSLVRLYDVFGGEDQSYFTMELVRGVDLLRWVWRDDASPPRVDHARLRAALAQLAGAVRALHSARKLHRDIKPANVVVTDEGRVVLLDFGLVRDVDDETGELGQLDDVEETAFARAGTPEYMSPEQAAGDPLGPASDWYAVGALLYEALTGQRPLGGPRMKMLMDKQLVDPPPPSTLAPTTPADLDALCARLVRRDPRERPSGSEVLRHLGVDSPESVRTPKPSTGRAPPSTQAASLVGRASELAALGAALAEAPESGPIVVRLRGPSGIGKTALARAFVAQVGMNETGRTIALSGRCHALRSGPYPAFAGVVEALARHLQRLPRESAASRMPADLDALGRMFPLLARVHALADTAPRRVEPKNPQELRRRGFAAFRELARNVAAERPLLVCIDDAHWGDEDSASLLAELLRAPGAPACLYLIGERSDPAPPDDPDERHRRDEGEWRLSLLDAATAKLPRSMEPVAIRELPLPPLTDADALALVHAVRARDLDDGEAEAIVRESAGVPWVLAERASSLAARLADLPDRARALLEVLCVARAPVPRALALAAADVGKSQATEAIGLLRVARLARAVRVRAVDHLEPHHELVRRTVASSLDDARALDLRRRLAVELSTAEEPDHEAMLAHREATGDRARAGEHALEAAERSVRALAFASGARLLRRALDLGELAANERRRLQRELADALAHSGQCLEAAHAYRDATRDATAAATLDLRRRAAEELLKSGHLDEGVAAIRDVLALVDMKLPSTYVGALLLLALYQLHLLVRGLGFRARDESQISAEALTRIDVCWTVAENLGVVDTIRTAVFQKRHVILALRTGERYRIARALALETGFESTRGTRGRARTAHVGERATALALESKSHHARGSAAVMNGLAAFLEQRWEDSRGALLAAERILRDECDASVVWELSNAQLFGARALFYLGRLREHAALVPALQAEAMGRGDVYLATDMSLWNNNMIWLERDLPDRAEAEADAAIARWADRGALLQHHYWLTARVQAALYRDDPAAALGLLRTWVPKLRRALLTRIQLVRIELTELEARARLLAARHDPAARAGHLATALRNAGRLARESSPMASAWSHLLEGLARSARGEVDRARESFSTATSAFEACGMTFHASVAAARRAGNGPDLDRASFEAALERLSAQGFREPARALQMMAPTPDRS